jgi:hypothetical protein
MFLSVKRCCITALDIYYIAVKWDKGRAMPVLAWTGPKGSRMSRCPQFLNSRHVKVVRLTALRAGRLHPLGSIYVRG